MVNSSNPLYPNQTAYFKIILAAEVYNPYKMFINYECISRLLISKTNFTLKFVNISNQEYYQKIAGNNSCRILLHYHRRLLILYEKIKIK